MPKAMIISNIRIRSIQVVYGSFGQHERPDDADLGVGEEVRHRVQEAVRVDDAIGIDPVDDVRPAARQGLVERSRICRGGRPR